MSKRRYDMTLSMLGNLILIFSLVILSEGLYHLIERVSRSEVEHAAGKNRRRKGSGMHIFFSKQPKGDTERGKIHAGKRPFTHGFVH
jgi:hypothetical protein